MQWTPLASQTVLIGGVSNRDNTVAGSNPARFAEGVLEFTVWSPSNTPFKYETLSLSLCVCVCVCVCVCGVQATLLSLSLSLCVCVWCGVESKQHSP